MASLPAASGFDPGAAVDALWLLNLLLKLLLGTLAFQPGREGEAKRWCIARTGDER